MNGRGDSESAPLQRLVDARGGTPGVGPAWAVDVVRRAPDYQPVPGRKQRLLLRLGRRRRAPAPLLLRFAVAAGLLIGGGAVASAALGYLPRWVARVYERIAPPRPIATASPPAHHTRARNGASPTAPAPAPLPASSQDALPPAVAPAPSVTADPPKVAFPAAGERVAAKGRPSRPATIGAAHSDDDPSLVMRGMRALRREGDPARARALAERYLQSYPRGSVAEEALALAIEAALARGDADTEALGRRYLQLYPRGPFRDLAQRASSAAPGAPRP